MEKEEPLEESKHPLGLHIIAAFEALKGIVVLAAGLGLLHYLHEDLVPPFEHLLMFSGLGHNQEYHDFLIHLVSGITDGNIIMLSVAAVAYSALRFVEAYGLWLQRKWAKWLAIVAGGIYLPYEVYKLSEHFTAIKLVIVLINVLVVLYLIDVRND
jgi:uncharacterized membrane protein (DUF2068 family)